MSSSPTATSATTIQVPVPTATGDSALILRDPNNSMVLGSALFTLYTKTINQCKQGTNCGAGTNP